MSGLDNATRRERLKQGKRQLTKILIIAAKLKYGVDSDIDIGDPTSDEIEEAYDFLKHGSIHIPTIRVNTKNIEGFGKYVVAWSLVSVVTGILDILNEMEVGAVLVGLPNEKALLCITTPSTIEAQFEGLPTRNRS